MFNNSTIEGKDLQTKQEGDYNQPKYASTSRQWAGFKNPRIVRVSKAFGVKDRHSKVTTVKGLRDRRIRLSVPTALQLYDLQDKLGLNQPSKVIDWLLDSTKDDIDQLPPLQMLPNQFHLVPPALIPQDLNSPQVSFSQFLNSTPNATFVKDVGNRTLLYTKQGIKLNHNASSDINEDDHDHQRKKGKEAQALTIENKWRDEENGGLNFFPIPQYSYNNTGLLPYNPYYNWEPSSNLSISQFGNQDHSSIPSASQFSFSPPPPPTPAAMITPSSLPPYLMHHDLNTTRQNSHFHLLSSSSQHAPPNSLMPLFNSGESEEKLPFGLDAPRPKVRLPKTNHLHPR